MATADADRTRAWAFITSVQDRIAAENRPFFAGTVLSHPSFPLVWDMNYVRVEGSPNVTAEQLAKEADRLQGGGNLRHRKLVVEDDRLGQNLAPGLTRAGWKAVGILMMAARREPETRRRPMPVRELSLDEIKRARERSLRRDPDIAGNEQAVAQLRDQVQPLAERCNARFFGAETGGEIGSVCELYSDGRTGQIEGVMTLEEHRNKGLARAVVLAALQAARKAGSDFIFLTAEADDWPKDLYARLGFEPVGRFWEFNLDRRNGTRPTEDHTDG
jgi:GNAT superfamily N-acetyltransferase